MRTAAAAVLMAICTPATVWAQGAPPLLANMPTIDADVVRQQTLADQVDCRSVAAAQASVGDQSFLAPSNPIAYVVTVAAVALATTAIQRSADHKFMDLCMEKRGYTPTTPSAEDGQRLQAARASGARLDPSAIVVSYAVAQTRFPQVSVQQQADGQVVQTYTVGRY